MTREKSMKINNLGNELFKRLEMNQGYSYISDGIFGTPEHIFEVARNSKAHHRKCVEAINKFLKKHRQPL